MEQKNKLIILDNDYSSIDNFESNTTNKCVFLVLSSKTINVDIKYSINSYSNLFIKVIVINSQINKVNINFNINIKGNYNNANISILGYGLDKSTTNVIANFVVDTKTSNNIVNQKIKGILLSNETKFHGEPNLNINTLDIKAKHSLNIGYLNQDEIFYLQSKGIEQDKAKKIILDSLLQDMICDLDEIDKIKCNNLINERLNNEN